MRDIRVALWGISNHSINRVLPALNSIKGIEIYGVCSRNIINVSNVSKKYSCKGWTDFEDMLVDEVIDVVFICLPIKIHFFACKSVLDNSKHVWCEKPLTCCPNETKELINIAKKKNLMLVESFMYQFHPGFNEIKKSIDENINSCKKITINFGVPNLENPGFRNSKEMCGGAFWDVGSYPISAISDLFYNYKIKILKSAIHYRKNCDVDNYGFALIDINGFIIASLFWGVGVSYRNEIDIWFDDKSLFFDKFFSKPKNYKSFIVVSSEKGHKEKIFLEEVEQFEQMFRLLKEHFEEGDFSRYYDQISNRSAITKEIIDNSKFKV